MEVHIKRSGIPISKNNRSNMRKNRSKSIDVLFTENFMQNDNSDLDSFTLLEENIAMKEALESVKKGSDIGS